MVTKDIIVAGKDGLYIYYNDLLNNNKELKELFKPLLY